MSAIDPKQTSGSGGISSNRQCYWCMADDREREMAEFKRIMIVIAVVAHGHSARHANWVYTPQVLAPSKIAQDAM